MKNFKVTVTKGTQKFDLIRRQESEELLKNDLHKEGFSIVTITEIGEENIQGARFYFEINQNGALKQGSIISNDIFKAFLKIKIELGWDLVYIYQNKDDILEEKQKNMRLLNEQYKVYLETHKKELDETQKKEDKKQKVVKEETTQSFGLQKDLQKAYLLIDKVLEKLKYFIELQNEEVLPFSRKEKIKDIYNNIVRLKTSTNVSKLYQIAEIGLSKVGEVELELVEKQKDDEYRDLLKSTNKLLKETGSKKQFIEKEKDLSYILKKIYLDLKEKFKQDKKEKIVIDTKSSLYLKTKVLYERYNLKYKELQNEYYKNILKTIIPTKENKIYLEELSIKKHVLQNNIFIFKSRLTGSTFSYTKLVKGYTYTSDLFMQLFLILQKYFLNIFVIYALFLSLILLLNNVFGFNFNINFSFLVYIIIINLGVFLVYLSRGIITLFFNMFIILSLLTVFVINF